MREALGEAGHGLVRADGVGEGGLDPGLLVPARAPGRRAGRRGVPRSRASGRGTGQSTRSASTAPLGVEVDEPHGLAVVGLGEGVGERRAGVADALGDGLAAVQMAERDVVDAVEDAGGHGGDPADGDVALAVAGLRRR